MSNITITHASGGPLRLQVLRSERVTPHMTRVTFGGGDLSKLRWRGFDQWGRLAIPVHEDIGLDKLPERITITSYLRMFTMPKGVRPVLRNYTLRQFRPQVQELDIDFLVHGTAGVAGPWAAAVQGGEEIGYFDQGCAWNPPAHTDSVLLITDESGLPAVAGILRDLPRNTVGHALIELFDAADKQPLAGPEGVKVQWLQRSAEVSPGTVALPALEQLDLNKEHSCPYGFAVGEAALATGARRHLVRERGIPKADVTFCGYWRLSRRHS